VLHGCGQTAHDIAHGSGWTTLANETGFALLLPEQRRSNNLQRGFNWFRPGDTKRGRGEVLSIRQMVKQMIEDHGLDRKSVFVTGLSAGGAMTAALLSAYPDVFAGGAVIAGVPFGVASNLWGALAAMKGDKYDSSDDLGDKVRASSRHRGCWPKISVWHGDTDTTVAPSNADAIVRQWCNVHGIDEGTPAKSSISGQLRRFWRNSTGIPVIEEIIIPDMGHAVPINALGKRGHAYGTAAPFFEDAGISAAYYIAKFWGLTGRKR
jgi:feruloyl esterase